MTRIYHRRYVSLSVSRGNYYWIIAIMKCILRTVTQSSVCESIQFNGTKIDVRMESFSRYIVHVNLLPAGVWFESSSSMSYLYRRVLVVPSCTIDSFDDWYVRVKSITRKMMSLEGIKRFNTFPTYRMCFKKKYFLFPTAFCNTRANSNFSKFFQLVSRISTPQ